MADYVISGTVLTAIADAIREVTGETSPIPPEGMPWKVSECYQKGYVAGEEAGKAECGGGEEILFTAHGTMYQRNMVITAAESDGFYQYAYRYADKMEALSVPNLKSIWTSSGYVFQGCTALKTASLPRIMRIGAYFFGDCPALEEVFLGSEETPMEAIAASALYNCPSLVRFRYVGVIPTNLNLAYSPLLDDVSCVNIANCLADLTGKTAQTLTVHPAVGARMVELGLDVIIRDKNWTLAF